MATFPSKAPQAPEAFENGSGFHGDKTTPKAIPPATDTSPNPKTPAPKTPEHGRRTQDNPGAVVYDSAKPKKASGGRMIRVSKILTRYQDLTVEEEPGDSALFSALHGKKS